MLSLSSAANCVHTAGFGKGFESTGMVMHMCLMSG
jgi:hypothetical protein